MRKSKLIFLIAVIIAGVIILTMFFCRRNKYKDLCEYTEKLLKIEWNDCIELATGNVEIVYGEEVAYIKLVVRRGYEEEVLNIVENRFGQSLVGRIKDIIPSGEVHEFAVEIKNGNLQYASGTAMEGNRIKTRNVDVYVVYDEEGQMCIYIMG